MLQELCPAHVAPESFDLIEILVPEVCEPAFVSLLVVAPFDGSGCFTHGVSLRWLPEVIPGRRKLEPQRSTH